jgi:hypothetical protein
MAAAFAQPHQLVDVGGYRLNLHCSGSGANTVAFEAPAGDGPITLLDFRPHRVQFLDFASGSGGIYGR